MTWSEYHQIWTKKLCDKRHVLACLQDHVLRLIHSLASGVKFQLMPCSDGRCFWWMRVIDLSLGEPHFMPRIGIANRDECHAPHIRNKL